MKKSITIFAIITCVWRCTKAADCNYVANYTVTIEEGGQTSTIRSGGSTLPGSATPINVCNTWTFPPGYSSKFVCNNGLVQFESYQGSTECIGDPTVYPVNYTDAECSASQTCPYLAWTSQAFADPSCLLGSSVVGPYYTVINQCIDRGDVCLCIMFLFYLHYNYSKHIIIITLLIDL